MADEVWLSQPFVQSFVLLFEKTGLGRGGSYGFYSRSATNVDGGKMGVVTLGVTKDTRRYKTPGLAFAAAKKLIKTHENAQIITVKSVFNGVVESKFPGSEGLTIRYKEA